MSDDDTIHMKLSIYNYAHDEVIAIKKRITWLNDQLVGIDKEYKDMKNANNEFVYSSIERYRSALISELVNRNTEILELLDIMQCAMAGKMPKISNKWKVRLFYIVLNDAVNKDESGLNPPV